MPCWQRKQAQWQRTESHSALNQAGDLKSLLIGNAIGRCISYIRKLRSCRIKVRPTRNQFFTISSDRSL
eukprot:3740059-Pyramimonas_sp.AAC.1